MRFHNTNEEVVFTKVDEIFDFIKRTGNPDNISFSEQCRVDTICYVLNRVKPRYVVSNRGVARVGQELFDNQQQDADINFLVYEAIKQVNSNMRPEAEQAGADAIDDSPVFNIPTILGRLFNGINFAPMTDVTLELRCNGELVPMINGNWQNPYKIVSYTAGMFTFWPSPVSATASGISRVFEFVLAAECADFEPVKHFFEVPVLSEAKWNNAFSMGRTVKLPELYMFPLTEEESQQACLKIDN
jgi:competence protein ComFB